VRSSAPATAISASISWIASAEVALVRASRRMPVAAAAVARGSSISAAYVVAGARGRRVRSSRSHKPAGILDPQAPRAAMSSTAAISRS